MWKLNEKGEGKMLLYHTGAEEIRVPDLLRGRKNADFGQGFYLTPDRDFAVRWAGSEAVLNRYSLDTEGLGIRCFTREKAWLEAILSNRRAQDGLRADVIIGPIANDTIFDTMGIISSGFLSEDIALRLLMVGPEYTQVAIKTRRALDRLRFLGSERISGMDSAQRQEEQRAYQEALAGVMESLDRT